MNSEEYIYARYVAAALERALRAADEAQRPHEDVAILVRIRPADLERLGASDLAGPAGVQCQVRVGDGGASTVDLDASWTLTSMRAHLEAAIDQLKE